MVWCIFISDLHLTIACVNDLFSVVLVGWIPLYSFSTTCFSLKVLLHTFDLWALSRLSCYPRSCSWNL